MRETGRTGSAILLIAFALAACAPAMVNQRTEEHTLRLE